MSARLGFEQSYQGIAVTGSVNQNGDVQRVIIPQNKVQHLMLREDIVEVIKEGGRREHHARTGRSAKAPFFAPSKRHFANFTACCDRRSAPTARRGWRTELAPTNRARPPVPAGSHRYREA